MATEQSTSTTSTHREAVPKDDSRLEMMRRVKRMSVEERLELFDRLSRRVTWARLAKRVRRQIR
jgi:hypothetical protein